MKKILIIILIAIVVAVGIWFYLKDSAKPPAPAKEEIRDFRDLPFDANDNLDAALQELQELEKANIE